MMRVVVSGSSGLIGGALCRSLREDGARVERLVRRPVASDDEITWDPAAGTLDPNALSGAGAVVNFNGVSIGASRWTEAAKRAILESRVGATTTLARAIAQASEPPGAFVSMSAVGYYGSTGDEVLDETAPAADDFLAQVCRQWEASTAAAADAGVRTVILRSGIVLTPAGPPLSRMLIPFKLGLGGRIGSGNQWLSWIALDDAVAIIRFAIGNERLEGPVNSTTPGAVRQSEFARILARVLRRPALVPTPTVALKAIYGRELVKHLLVEGQRVAPRALEAAGYEFEYPELESALRALLGR